MARRKVGVLGFGFIGKIHAKALENSKLGELAGVWTQPEASVSEFQSLYPGKKLYDSPEAMLADPEIQAVVIGMPNSFHHPIATKALQAGKHVLVEKPMAMSVAQSLEMAQLASQKGLTLMVAHMWRFDREVKAVRQLVEEGKLGEIIKTKSYGIHENWGPAGWFTKKSLAGGGALIDMGVHAIDTTRFLLGDPQPVSVYAVVETRYGDYDVDDSGVLVIRWDNGVTSVVESGWWNAHMDGPEASTQLFGKQGYARVFPTLAKFGTGEEPWLPRFPVRADHCEQPMYDLQMAEFLGAIEEKRQPHPGTAEGLVVMRICEAAYESARTGSVVKL